MSDNLLILKKPFESVAVRQLACALTKKWQLMQDAKIHTDFLEKKLQYQATHDSLTSLPNRVLLIDCISQGIAHASRNKILFSIMYIGLDRFKLVNDSVSHEAGDELLIALSERLRRNHS